LLKIGIGMCGVMLLSVSCNGVSGIM